MAGRGTVAVGCRTAQLSRIATGTSDSSRARRIGVRRAIGREGAGHGSHRANHGIIRQLTKLRPMRVHIPHTVAVALVLLSAGCSDRATGDARAEPASARGALAVPGVRMAAHLDSVRLDSTFASAAAMPRLRSLVVQWRDTVVREGYWRGGAPDRPTNIKSASKSVIAALVGAAIADGHLRLDQPLAELLPAETRALEAEKQAITVEDLVSMRAGLGSTSFAAYGNWVASGNWVRTALAQPIEAPRGARGGPMIYSTGSTHLLSAALTRATGRSTLRYARERLLAPLGITARPWTADPQGIYLGGNEMAMTPRELLAFGTLYLHRGRTPDGQQVIPAAWIDSSWVARGHSRWSGDGYGYGWWIRRRPPHTVYYAWGYGGQMVFVVPPLELVVVMTSDAYSAREGGHVEALRRMVTDAIIPAVSEPVRPLPGEAAARNRPITAKGG